MSKHNGTIEFDSKGALFVFRTLRFFARLTLLCAVIAALMLMGRRDSQNPNPTLADATLTLSLFGVWLLMKVLISLRIKKGMQDAAARQRMSLGEYVKKTRRAKYRTSFELSHKAKYPETERGRQRLWEEAVDRLFRRISNETEVLKHARLLAHDPEGSERALVRAQNKGQEIVDKCCREFAIDQYAKRNDLSRADVSALLRAENGRGPVTKAVDEIYRKVHYQYKAHFENLEYTWRGHVLKQGVGGIKERIDRKY